MKKILIFTALLFVGANVVAAFDAVRVVAFRVTDATFPTPTPQYNLVPDATAEQNQATYKRFCTDGKGRVWKFACVYEPASGPQAKGFSNVSAENAAQNAKLISQKQQPKNP